MKPEIIPLHIIKSVFCFSCNCKKITCQQSCSKPKCECEKSSCCTLKCTCLNFIFWVYLFTLIPVSISVLVFIGSKFPITLDSINYCCYYVSLFPLSITLMSLSWLGLTFIPVVIYYLIKELSEGCKVVSWILYFFLFWLFVSISSVGFSIINSNNFVNEGDLCFENENYQC